MQYETIELSNGLPVILAPRAGTPRMALAVAMQGGILYQTRSGMVKLAYRLLQKGTEKRSAEKLARDLDERAIDLHELVQADSAGLVAVFLNSELPVVLDILQDILLHSTFADFEKERAKLAGEIQASLDMPSERAQDLLGRTLFAGHPYGDTGTRTLQQLPELSEEEVKQWYFTCLHPRRMNVTLVGDFSPAAVAPQLEDAFSRLPPQASLPSAPLFQPLTLDSVVTEAQQDAHQAQIFQGWYAPPLGTADVAAFTVMNVILGAAGLSSRLFIELREKQGLAYSVRSQYLPMGQAGEFVISIGTSPENISRARQGFSEQLARLQQDPILPDELQKAIGRISGSYILGHETTSQQCLDFATSQIVGLGVGYSERQLERIQQVTIADVQQAARSIVPPSVTAIVGPAEALAAVE